MYVPPLLLLPTNLASIQFAQHLSETLLSLQIRKPKRLLLLHEMLDDELAICCCTQLYIVISFKLDFAFVLTNIRLFVEVFQIGVS